MPSYEGIKYELMLFVKTGREKLRTVILTKTLKEARDKVKQIQEGRYKLPYARNDLANWIIMSVKTADVYPADEGKFYDI